MKTAEEMYKYCLKNGYGRGLTKKWAIRHFGVIEANLRDDEEVYMTYIGLKDYISPTKHDGNYGYAITNKRIVFGQKKVIGESFKSVVFDKINDVSSSTGMIMGTVTIDTLGETFNVGVDKKTAVNISKEANRIIFDMRSNAINNAQKNKNETGEQELDEVSELSRYQDLMIRGIITKEEFLAKKKDILGK